MSYLVSYGQILQSLLEVFLNKLFEISLAVYCKIINKTSNFVVFFSGECYNKNYIAVVAELADAPSSGGGG